MRNSKSILIILTLVLVGFVSVGQPPGDPNGGGIPGGDVPISGLEILLVAGGLFGAKKLFDKRRSKDN